MLKKPTALAILLLAPATAIADLEPLLADRHLETEYVEAAHSQDWDTVEMLEMDLERRYRSRGGSRQEIRERLQQLERAADLDLQRSLDRDDDTTIDDDDGERRVRNARMAARREANNEAEAAAEREARRERVRARSQASDRGAAMREEGWERSDRNRANAGWGTEESTDEDDDGVPDARPVKVKKVKKAKKLKFKKGKGQG